MDFELSDELIVVRDLARQIANDVVAPRAREIDLTSLYPTDIFEVFATTGLLGLCIPTEYGGAGVGILGLAIAVEEMAKFSSTAALMLLLTRLAPGPILIGGTKEQKLKYLPQVASGSQRASFALSESQAGSDVMGMSTHASQDSKNPEVWVINGRKCWISGISEADFFCVFAKTKPVENRTHDSITCFIVDRNAPGVKMGTIDRKLGVHGVNTGELFLNDVQVNSDQIVGGIGGFRLAMHSLNAMRPVVAARGLGLAQGAMRYGLEYIKQRDAFGKKVSEFQGIRWEVSKIAVEIEAARMLMYKAATLADAGNYTKEYVPYLSMSKYYATEVAVRASGLAIQLLGAAGYMMDHPVEMFYRDAKQLTIVEGTSQIQLDLIARGIFDGDIRW